MLITEKRLRKVIRKTILEHIKAQLEEAGAEVELK